MSPSTTALAYLADAALFVSIGYGCGWLFGGDAMKAKMQSAIGAAEATAKELRVMALNLASVIDAMKMQGELPPDDICCCGDSMENHAAAWDCGHTAKSMRAYSLECSRESKKGKA